MNLEELVDKMEADFKDAVDAALTKTTEYIVEFTPIDTGNAKRSTTHTKGSDSIKLDYDYAGDLMYEHKSKQFQGDFASLVENDFKQNLDIEIWSRNG